MTSRTIQSKIDRHRSILDTIATRKRISLAELELLLGTPRITIQRDLVELENRGAIKRYHGGAMSLQFSAELYNHGMRKQINVGIKKKIAAKAVRFIEPGFSYVGMDPSSTVYFMSECMLPGDITVIACGIDTFTNLSQTSHITAVLTGGRINRKTTNLAGDEAISTIRKFRYDIVFISAEFYQPGAGFFDLYEDEAAVKRAFIDCSNKTVMLLDSSKIRGKGSVLVCRPDEIDALVTDNPGQSDLAAAFREKLH